MSLFPGVPDALVCQCDKCNAFYTVDRLGPIPESDPRRKAVPPAAGLCPACNGTCHPIAHEVEINQ